MKSKCLEELDDLAKHRKVDSVDERMFRRHVSEYGIDGSINNCLNFLSACREILPSGVHRCQTTSYIYDMTFAEIKFVFENYEPTLDLTTVVRKCITEHQLNLTFEKDHPPVDLRNKTKKTSKRKVKEEGDLFPDLPKVKKKVKKEFHVLHFKFTTNGSTSV